MKIDEIRRFRRTLRSFERVTNLQLRTCCSGVTLAQCLVLMEIDENARLTVGELAARLRLDNSTLSRTLDGLVGKGLVERLRDGSDRRVVWTRLTSEGEAVCRSLHQENDAHCRRVFARIPPSRRAAVIRGFETLVQAFLDCESASSRGAAAVPPTGAGRRESRAAGSRGAGVPRSGRTRGREKTGH